jgi:hypothetical protein
VFSINELAPIQESLKELNDWLGIDVVRFNPYALQPHQQPPDHSKRLMHHCQRVSTATRKPNRHVSPSAARWQGLFFSTPHRPQRNRIKTEPHRREKGH